MTAIGILMTAALLGALVGVRLVRVNRPQPPRERLVPRHAPPVSFEDRHGLPPVL